MTALFGKDRVCGVVAARTKAEADRAMLAALRETRTVELRLDWLENRAEIAKALSWLAAKRKGSARLGATIVATCRQREAGGKFEGTIHEQVEILRAAADAGCHWLDLEIETAEKISKAELTGLRRKARVMISYHNFRETPAGLASVRARLERVGGDAIKIAANAKTYRDASRLLEFARKSRRCVVVPMGDATAAARILALRSGSALTLFNGRGGEYAGAIAAAHGG